MCRVRIINDWFKDQPITKQSVESFFLHLKDEVRLKNNSLNTYRFVLRHLSEYRKDRGMPSDFLEGFKSFRKTRPDIVIFTQEEIERILNTELTYGRFHGKDSSFLDFTYRTMTMFLAYTGCRYSEAADLTVKHVDISAGKAMFVNTKTNENRTVYFTEPLKSKLTQLVKDRRPDDRVFRNCMDTLIQVSDFSADLKHRARVAGVTKRTFPHNFRHSYITHMLEAGVPITEVATLVGHKDIQTTYSTYMHLADKTLEKAAMRHPMVRRNVDPQEILRTLREDLDNYHLDRDERFEYKILREGGRLKVEISLRNERG
jgi:integrase/recombinase XerD